MLPQFLQALGGARLACKDYKCDRKVLKWPAPAALVQVSGQSWSSRTQSSSPHELITHLSAKLSLYCRGSIGQTSSPEARHGAVQGRRGLGQSSCLQKPLSSAEQPLFPRLFAFSTFYAHSPPRGSACHSPSPLPPKHSITQMENRGAARHSPLAYNQSSSAALWGPRLPPAGDGFWQHGEFLSPPSQDPFVPRGRAERRCPPNPHPHAAPLVPASPVGCNNAIPTP